MRWQTYITNIKDYVKKGGSFSNDGKICRRCSGVPLCANIHENAYKLIFMDIGMVNHVSGNDWITIQLHILSLTRNLNTSSNVNENTSKSRATAIEADSSPDMAF